MAGGAKPAPLQHARQAWAQAGYNAPLSCAAPIDCIADAAHVNIATLYQYFPNKEALVAALPKLPGPERLRIVHQTGPKMRDEVEAAYRALMDASIAFEHREFARLREGVAA